MVSKALMDTAKRIKQSADLVYDNGDQSSAFILYFKALLAACDYALSEKGLRAKDHSQRFRLLEKHFPMAYAEVDYFFKFYRDSYSTIIKEEICNECKKTVERFFKEVNIGG